MVMMMNKKEEEEEGHTTHTSTLRPKETQRGCVELFEGRPVVLQNEEQMPFRGKAALLAAGLL